MIRVLSSMLTIFSLAAFTMLPIITSITCHRVMASEKLEATPSEQIHPDDQVLLFIKNFYKKDFDTKKLLDLETSLVRAQLVYALQDKDRDIKHNALTLIRGIYGNTEMLPPVIEAFNEFLTHRSNDNYSSRIVCIEILRKYPNDISLPVLIEALDDPDYNSGLIGVGSHVERVYRSVSGEAIRAISAIAEKEFCARQSKKNMEACIKAVKTWWETKGND